MGEDKTCQNCLNRTLVAIQQRVTFGEEKAWGAGRRKQKSVSIGWRCTRCGFIVWNDKIFDAIVASRKAAEKNGWVPKYNGTIIKDMWDRPTKIKYLKFPIIKFVEVKT